jgi:hypothetical protein
LLAKKILSGTDLGTRESCDLAYRTGISVKTKHRTGENERCMLAENNPVWKVS